MVIFGPSVAVQTYSDYYLVIFSTVVGLTLLAFTPEGIVVGF